MDANYLNMYVFCVLSYGLESLYNRTGSRFRSFSLCLAVVIFTFMTGSRGALFAEICMIVWFIFKYTNIRNMKINWGWVVGTAVFLILSVFVLRRIMVNNTVLSDVGERFTIAFIQKYGTTNRTKIWKTLLELYMNSDLNRQIFGYGLGTTGYINPYRHYFAHNQIVEQLLSTGIIGVALYLIMFYVYYKKANQDIFMETLQIGLFTIGISLSTISYKPIWNCMALIYANYLCERKRQSELNNLFFGRKVFWKKKSV